MKNRILRAKSFRLVCALLMAAYPAIVSSSSSIVGSYHDLSSLPGAPDSQVCLFCHTPHKAATEGALWNRPSPVNSYKIYGNINGSMKANPEKGSWGQEGEISQHSLLCMSCHDGSVAVDSFLHPSQAGSHLMDGSGKFGNDLSSSHPVSFSYTQSIANGAQNLAPVIDHKIGGKLPLFGPDDTVECGTCHDSHLPEKGALRMSNDRSALCFSCHKL